MTFPDALGSLEKAVDEIVTLKRQLDDQRTIAMFWRQAAEHAIVGWNAEEDAHAATRDRLREMAEGAKFYIELHLAKHFMIDDKEAEEDLKSCNEWLKLLKDDAPEGSI